MGVIFVKKPARGGLRRCIANHVSILDQRYGAVKLASHKQGERLLVADLVPGGVGGEERLDGVDFGVGGG